MDWSTLLSGPAIAMFLTIAGNLAVIFKAPGLGQYLQDPHTVVVVSTLITTVGTLVTGVLGHLKATTLKKLTSPKKG